MFKAVKFNYDILYRTLGYQFKSKNLLVQALTHRSVSAVNNERLEFLGDSLLNLITAEYLFDKYPQLKEGDLSRTRSQYVNKDSLYMIAEALNIKDYIQLSVGERMGGGHNRPSILADSIEAIIAAVYLDSDYVITKRFVINLLEKFIIPNIGTTSSKDPKTSLQELLQCKHKSLPIYQLIETTGLAHDQSFTIECTITSLNISTRGSGKSRRMAEQQAALSALEKIKGNND
ncbi:MAG: ribonuclease III [Ferrovum sp. 37-45-19]|jgi:ribonuclease-3|uniref:ribonuclease III n=1 Tax=Ferrovum sp. JA12 TaxID=1356299 RepID=UPI000702EFF2|nr:ribonuclease III [Ferrovum sp. JA12]OYV80305.1 MAG: ribonuclease III [Ferrovum sp. 21-44-67]OYV95051.1 MAG: ribonuclease III [Ferrovum sp. 37-45-19]OZB32193.1 MAG: ribonuclease III [Ferrovum sp. 34-44-207]HQT80890.1 ribonuclease III [Ferrovaceae bacterium]KRH78732.1 ribonuclease 3 [Ferrovum sp. JA12]